MTIEYYTHSVQHILAEFERINLLIRTQVWRAKKIQEIDSEFQGLYISEQEVDELLKRSAGLPQWAIEATGDSLSEAPKIFDKMSKEIAQRKSESVQRGIILRLDRLARVFELSTLEVDILLVCLAPEFDLRYERLYAYLQDDVTKKRPSVDLVLNLLSPSFEAKLAARKHFSDSAHLFKYHLLHLFDDPTQQPPPLLGRYLKIDERIVNYLHDSDEIDSSLLPYITKKDPWIRFEDLILPEDVKRRLSMLAFKTGKNDQRMILYFQGPYGVGKQSTAEALCNELGMKLLTVNVETLLNVESANFDKTVRLVRREAILQNAALFWSGFDTLIADDRRLLLNSLLCELELQHGLNFLAGKATWQPVNALHHIPFVRLEFPRPTYADRAKLWAITLDGNIPSGADVDLRALAGKFRFSGGQIKDAAATACNLARWRNPENGHVTMADLHAACRLQSNRKLAELAQKITPHYKWDDIFLPRDRMQQLREIANYVKFCSLVYTEWGFNRKLSLGKGLNVLFAGPSGTGKTMAAEIMAGELGLDLYKIDLSTVVSKYIGETEKNLARIFAEAETSNAILFFDEADALFGKRSEVRDSHDRYANIEISYLLQKMEEYEGVVILATNLSKNMDDAFVRRMHFTIQFPFPSEKDRRRIWEKIWPKETPRNPDLDLEFMANRLEIAGGNIRNIALAAAFLAADDGNVVNMTHLIHATEREYQKMGKVVVEGDFGKYRRIATTR